MYKIKNKNYYALVNKNYDLLYFNLLIQNSDFIVFFNYKNLSNSNLLDLKNYISFYAFKSVVIHLSYIKHLFFNDFLFLNSYNIAIFINSLNDFNNIVKLLKNINFYFTFKKRFSGITNNILLSNQIKKYNNYIFFHYVIFKLINNIILIILYFKFLFLKFLK